MNTLQLWDRYRKYLNVNETVGVMVDISRMNFADTFFDAMRDPILGALEKMDALENGAIANPDENRMVGHYWLRNPSLAPRSDIAQAIETTHDRIKTFAAEVHSGALKSEREVPFRRLLVIGIGGSALGPQFVANALSTPADKMSVSFFDNTDPDGMDRTIHRLGSGLAETLTLVISKSGGTKETRNGMLEARAAYERAGLRFAMHAAAVTGEDSDLDRLARSEGWLIRFPMWDWVGGRTSELSAVGLLPAALQGFDIDAMLAGASAMDEVTREKEPLNNPAALLALMWYYAGQGRGSKDMVILPYKDRLELFSRYLQQLVMESLGKEKDMDGRVVHQGIAVYGNKGSTDQHAYVQQLREGVNNFFVTFIEVLRDRREESIEVETGVTSGDYLNGFLQGTRRALHENGRESITITVPSVEPGTIGKLIALFERAVGFYASLVHINAYHQPGVEAGKKAAAGVINIQNRILSYLAQNRGRSFSIEEIASAIGAREEIETVFKILHHGAVNPDHRVVLSPGKNVFENLFGIK
jgi:glucose-6-phosphate isomerase